MEKQVLFIMDGGHFEYCQNASKSQVVSIIFLKWYGITDICAKCHVKSPRFLISIKDYERETTAVPQNR